MLPDVSNVLTDWEVSLKLKSVDKRTVDFIPQDTVTTRDVLGVVQPADKEKLNLDNINWSLEYLMVHTKTEIFVGEFFEWQGRDYKIVDAGNYQLYGFCEAVAVETKEVLL